MTTILGVKVKDPVDAIILATDKQASYQEHVPVQSGVLFKDRKDSVRKLEKTDDDSIMYAMAGAATPQYYEFVEALRRGDYKDFHTKFDEEKKAEFESLPMLERFKNWLGSSVSHYNFAAITDNRQSPQFMTDRQFTLSMAYNIEDKLGLLEVTPTGVIYESNIVALGSGAEDAKKAFDVQSKLGQWQDGIKTDLPKLASVTWRAVDYAAMTDRGSSGVEIWVMTTGGIDNLSKEISDQVLPAYKKAETDLIKSLDTRYLTQNQAAQHEQ